LVRPVRLSSCLARRRVARGGPCRPTGPRALGSAPCRSGRRGFDPRGRVSVRVNSRGRPLASRPARRSRFRSGESVVAARSREASPRRERARGEPAHVLLVSLLFLSSIGCGSGRRLRAGAVGRRYRLHDARSRRQVLHVACARANTYPDRDPLRCSVSPASRPLSFPSRRLRAAASASLAGERRAAFLYAECAAPCLVHSVAPRRGGLAVRSHRFPVEGGRSRAAFAIGSRSVAAATPRRAAVPDGDGVFESTG